MNIGFIIILTLIGYSTISVLLYFLFGENEDILFIFGLGIVGCILSGILLLVTKFTTLFKYHLGKRSIFKENGTGKLYICKVKDAEEIRLWIQGYHLIKRYALKTEWKDLPYLPSEVVERSKINCDHCKYDNECKDKWPYDTIKCKHDGFGMILEFDKFEKR